MAATGHRAGTQLSLEGRKSSEYDEHQMASSESLRHPKNRPIITHALSKMQRELFGP